MKQLNLFLAAVAAFSISMQAQEVRYGTIEVGDYTNATEFYNGSYFDMAPTNFYLAHTGVQMIYTPDLLGDLEGKSNVVITKLKFKFYSETFEEIGRDYKVYLQETDAVEFAVDENGVKQFFDLGNLALEGNMFINMLNCYGEDVEISFPLTMYTPFALTPGKSLLVTVVFDAQDDDECTMGSDYAPFYTSGIRGRAMTYTNNWSSFLDYAQSSDFPNATATLGCGTNVELPVTLIEYRYTEGGQTGMRGDVNMSNDVTIADVTALIDYLLGGDASAINLTNADCNLDTNTTIADVTALIDYLLNGAW
jgi:hypothetical protein